MASNSNVLRNNRSASAACLCIYLPFFALRSILILSSSINPHPVRSPRLFSQRPDHFSLTQNAALSFFSFFSQCGPLGHSRASGSHPVTVTLCTPTPVALCDLSHPQHSSRVPVHSHSARRRSFNLRMTCECFWD